LGIFLPQTQIKINELFGKSIIKTGENLFPRLQK
jgi:hypothetical protein